MQKLNEVGKIPFESTTSIIGADPEKACMTALTGVENPHFPAIKEWVESFLMNETEVRFLCWHMHVYQPLRLYFLFVC